MNVARKRSENFIHHIKTVDTILFQKLWTRIPDVTSFGTYLSMQTNLKHLRGNNF